MYKHAQPITVGLDIGYGVVKAITTPDVTDQNIITFPSVCGHAFEIKFKADELAQKYPGDQIVDEEGIWFVGDLALSQVPTAQLLKLRGRTANESNWGNLFRARFAKVALGKLLPGRKDGSYIDIRIATGLPVNHMGDAATLKSLLLGQYAIVTDNTNFVANVTDVMVMPQPYGTIYANMLTPSGDLNDCHAYSRTAVCDIGTYTIDLAVDEDGEYIETQSGGVEGGVYTAQERIAAALERDFNEPMGYKIVEQVLRTRCVRVRGKSVDYSGEVNQAYEPLRDATINLMNEKWKSAARLDVIYLSGGGAEPVASAVQHVYEQAQLVPMAQTANAQGYLNYARFQSKK